ncbi:MAG TPA: NADH-quinone oxidoreductase subunit M [Candidatus Dormibacteraeota bacterium]|nr:NADH-quinone oxidoreductase subunit M [Candidatus Dormibacteraeota bacterium]
MSGVLAPALAAWSAAPWLEAIPTPSVSATPVTFGSNVIGFSFLLSVLVWGPVLMAMVTAVVPLPRTGPGRIFLGIAFWTNAAALGLIIIGYQQFQAYASGLQFEERLPWLPSLGVSYHLGADGIGMSLLLLNGLVGLCAVIASWDVRERARTYFVLLLLTQAALNGVVVARDLFVLVLFWAAATVPVAVLAVGWASPQRPGAGGRLIAYWGAGTAALLAGVLLLYAATGSTGFDLDTLGQAALSPRLQLVVGVLFALAALTRLPLVPFHSWARDLYAEAPAGVVVLVAGAASRLGGYVLVRLLAGIEHDASRTLAPFLGALAALTVVYAVLAALYATDVRRIAAYLALLPGGLAVLGVAGLTPLSLDGTVMLLFAGGLAAALVAGAAASLTEHAQARSLSLAAGLAGRIPKLSWLLLAGCLAVLGMPLLATFPSGLMVFLGSFRTQAAATFVAAIGLVLGAVAIGRLARRVLFGAPNPDAPAPTDLSLHEAWYLGILVGALLWVGLLPSGPKLFGLPVVDPGLVNVVNTSTADLASTYAQTTPAPRTTAPRTPAPPSSPSGSPSPAPSGSSGP